MRDDANDFADLEHRYHRNAHIKAKQPAQRAHEPGRGEGGLLLDVHVFETREDDFQKCIFRRVLF